MITIYLIRHGETLWNKKGRYQGIADVELSEKGILQADKIEDYFRDIKLDAVISSPLKRAVRRFRIAALMRKQHKTVSSASTRQTASGRRNSALWKR